MTNTQSLTELAEAAERIFIKRAHGSIKSPDGLGYPGDAPRALVFYEIATALHSLALKETGNG